MKREKIELLAPAGDATALAAALEAGADAVYFGLTALNARRRARNFRPQEFVAAVEETHRRGARAYLTLNVDLAEREVGQAVRILELARHSGADAVLVRDPALLGLVAEFPQMEFHASTQSAVTNSADVAALGGLGVRRAVLAREMTLAEIAAASSVPDVATEVFVQGALCFCVSGRCLLSSWVGGRSGNRGACTSPCRVPYAADGQPLGTPLSMRDLGALPRLAELRAAGVAAVKIEGRLKSAAWVRQAVGLYRQALDGQPVEPLLAELCALGDYTGRELTCGYLDGRRDELTGLSGRVRSQLAAAETPASEEADDEPADNVEAESSDEPADDSPVYDFSMNVEQRGIVCRCVLGGEAVEWSLPKTVIRRAHKAVAIGAFLERLAAAQMQGCRLAQSATNDPEFLLTPRAANGLVDELTAALRKMLKPANELVRIELPAALHKALQKDAPHKANRLALGSPPNRVRLEAAAAAGFVRRVRPEAVVVEGATASGLEKLLRACGGAPLVVALPAVLFEHELPGVRELLAGCARQRITVEVNSWGGWHLARAAGVRMEGGPGMAVLNSLAARTLGKLGLASATLSIEAERRQLEELTAACALPCTLVVFGRPPLMTSRAELAQDVSGKVLTDRRGMAMQAHRERGLGVFRPVTPFDLRSTKNERIRAAHLLVDLTGSPDPLANWYETPSEERPFRFNYDRTLA